LLLMTRMGKASDKKIEKPAPPPADAGSQTEKNPFKLESIQQPAWDDDLRGNEAGHARSRRSAKAAKEVSGTLFGIAALQFVCGLALTAMMPDLQASVAIIVGIAVVFAALGCFALVQPFPAAMIGLVLYIIILLLDFVTNPEFVMKGILVKVAIIGALVKSLQTAANANSD